MSDEYANAFKEQLDRLICLLSQPSADICWTRYETADEVIEELQTIESQILQNDNAAIKRLLHLLAPTGALQEISISSGWGYEFLDIAASLESILQNLG